MLELPPTQDDGAIVCYLVDRRMECWSHSVLSNQKTIVMSDDTVATPEETTEETSTEGEGEASE